MSLSVAYAAMDAPVSAARLPTAQPTPTRPPTSVPVVTTLPESVAEVEALRAQGARWTDKEVRALYVARARSIGELDASWRAQGYTHEERAHMAYDTRHQARLTARAMMSSWFEVLLLKLRDFFTYGHCDGPTFAQLYNDNVRHGMTPLEAYAHIVTTAQQTAEGFG